MSDDAAVPLTHRHDAPLPTGGGFRRWVVGHVGILLVGAPWLTGQPVAASLQTLGDEMRPFP